MTDFEPTNELRWVEHTHHPEGIWTTELALQQRWCLDAGAGYAKAYQWRPVPTIKQES